MRLIDADALLSQVKRSREKNPYTGAMLGTLNAVYDFVHRDVLNLIDSAPAIDAEPVRHGEREHVTVWHSAAWGELYTVYKCCGFRERGKTWHNYCPNCGAKMDEEVQHV